MPKKSLNNNIKSIFVYYINEVSLFRSNYYNMSWCCKNPKSYWPGYHTISLLGNNIFTKIINRYFSQYAIISKKTSKKIVTELKKNYFIQIKKNGYQFNKEATQLFTTLLQQQLEKKWYFIKTWSLPELFTCLNACSVELFKICQFPDDLYIKNKHYQNKQCAQFYSELRPLILSNNLPFESLMYLVIKANYIDNYNNDPTPFIHAFKQEINEIIDSHQWVKDYSKDNPLFSYLHLKVSLETKKQTILYECDNNGEIYFDLLFIEFLLLQNHTVIISLKDKPILNDITFDNFNKLINQKSLNHFNTYIKSKQLQIINNKCKDVIPIRYKMSQDYINAYKKANLVLLKGQGNFESYPYFKSTLFNKHEIHYKNKHFYLFVIKSSFTLKSMKSIYKNSRYDQLILLPSDYLI